MAPGGSPAFAATPICNSWRPTDSLAFSSEGLTAFAYTEARSGARPQPPRQSSLRHRQTSFFGASAAVRSFIGNPLPRGGRAPRADLTGVERKTRTLRCAADVPEPSAAEKLEKELEELKRELETVEKTLGDLNELITQNDADPKFQTLRTNLKAQAAAIEEAKTRLQTDLAALREQAAEERRVRASASPERSPSPEVSVKAKSAAGRRVRDVLRAVNKLSESIDTAETEADQKEALEENLAALEERLLALSRRRKELDAREASTLESAMKAENSAKRKEMLTALKADLESDTQQLDAELIDLANEVEILRQRLLQSQPKSGPAITIDLPSLQREAQKSVKKIKEGVYFFWRGTKLLGVDAWVAVRAMTRAVEGKPLSQRDVEHMKRFAMDLLAVIPFSIILIIPLSPVGHVFIFGLIQKYVPALMPSTFQPERVLFMERLESVQAGLSKKGAAPASDASSSSSSFSTVAIDAPVIAGGRRKEGDEEGSEGGPEGPSGQSSGSTRATADAS
eukprot:tig00000615_g2569.t1